MIFLRGLTTSITMVPSRLGGPSLGPPNPLGIFIANVSFWPCFFVFFFKSIFTIVTKTVLQREKTVLGMRKEMTNPIQARWCKAGWFWRLWWCLWVLEPDNGHRCWCTHEHYRPVWGLSGARAQPCTNEIPGCTTNFFWFFRFSGGKTVCSPDLCLGQGI